MYTVWFDLMYMIVLFTLDISQTGSLPSSCLRSARTSGVAVAVRAIRGTLLVQSLEKPICWPTRVNYHKDKYLTHHTTIE